MVSMRLSAVLLLALVSLSTACNFAQFNQTDFPQADYSHPSSVDFASCQSACCADSVCTAFTWTANSGGNSYCPAGSPCCWPKNAHQGTYYPRGNSALTSGIKYVPNPTIFAQVPGYDLVSGNYNSFPTDYASCQGLCASDSNCVGYSWAASSPSIGNNHQCQVGQNCCYLKATVGAYNPNAAITSAIKITACQNSVAWQQTQTNQWSDGVSTWTQYTVNLQVGSSPLYAATFAVVGLGSDTVTRVSGATPLANGQYSVIKGYYTNGVIAAGSTAYSFMYTIKGSPTSQAQIYLTNNACSPPIDCNANAWAVNNGSWYDSQQNLYQQYRVAVQENNSARVLSSVDVQINPTAPVSTVYNVFNMQQVSTGVYRCYTNNLAASSSPTVTGCGFQIQTPNGVAGTAYASTSVSLVQSVCL